MNWFWIIGIVANVTLTVLALVWVLRQGRPRRDDAAPAAPSAQEGQAEPAETPSKTAT